MRYANFPLGANARWRGPEPGFDLRVRRRIWRQLSLHVVEFVDEHVVEAEIGDEREAIVGRRADPVRVRGLLALFVEAVAAVLHEAARDAEAAVGLDLERGDAAAVVVGDEDEATRFVERDEAGAGAVRGDLIQKFKLAGFAIDLEGTDRAAFFAVVVADFVDGVEIFAVGVDGDEGWVGRFGDEADRGEFAGGGIEIVGVDAFAFLLGGVGADVGEVERGFVGGFRRS